MFLNVCLFTDWGTPPSLFFNSTVVSCAFCGAGGQKVGKGDRKGAGQPREISEMIEEEVKCRRGELFKEMECE